MGRPIPAACPEVGGGTDTPVTSRLGSESAQSQADWDSEEPDLMKNVPSHGRKDGLEWSLKVTYSFKQSDSVKVLPRVLSLSLYI